jgi:hypothetical protein
VSEPFPWLQQFSLNRLSEDALGGDGLHPHPDQSQRPQTRRAFKTTNHDKLVR